MRQIASSTDLRQETGSSSPLSLKKEKKKHLIGLADIIFVSAGFRKIIRTAMKSLY